MIKFYDESVAIHDEHQWMIVSFVVAELIQWFGNLFSSQSFYGMIWNGVGRGNYCFCGVGNFEGFK